MPKIVLAQSANAYVRGVMERGIVWGSGRKWGETGGGSPGEMVREAGEERAGGGSLQGAGSGRPR